MLDSLKQQSLCYLAGFLFLSFSVLVKADQASSNFVQTYLNTQVYSPATPIMQWFDTMTKKPNSGRYAYEDSRMGVRAMLSGWELGYELRRYDYLSFNAATLDFYYALEQNRAYPKNAKLHLDITSFRADGPFIGKTLEFNRHKLRLALHYYQIYDYQLGTLDGLSRSDNKISATAKVNYIFSDDKLLDYKADAQRGYALSLDADYKLNLNKDFTYQLELRDFINQVRLDKAGFTEGCINVGQAAAPICSSIAAGSGRSGERVYTTRLPFSMNTQLGYQPYKLDIGFFYHQDVRSLFVKKHWHYYQHQFQLGLKSIPSLLLGWAYRGIKLNASFEHYAVSELKSFSLNASYTLSW